MYDKFGILDPAGRSRSWRGWLFAEVDFVATSAAPVTTDAGMELRPTTQLTICGTPTSLWFPVLDDSDPMLADQALIAWLRNVADAAHWMASVCAGAGLLAAAGLLQGRRATTHWAYRNQLAAMDAESMSVSSSTVGDADVQDAAGAISSLRVRIVSSIGRGDPRCGPVDVDAVGA